MRLVPVELPILRQLDPIGAHGLAQERRPTGGYRCFDDRYRAVAQERQRLLKLFFAKELARRGCSGVVIQKEMGHKNYATTEKYLHLADTERHRATFALFAGETGRSAEPSSIYEAL